MKPVPLAVTGLADPAAERPIAFDPVARRRVRRNGWTEATHRAFIEALADCGCVTRAARAVGMTARSAYRLLDAPGADSFAAAWDIAIATGIEGLRAAAFDRAINGAWVAVMRRGRIVRHEHRHNDRLAIALLAGRGRGVAHNRERAGSRREYRAMTLAERERQAAERAHAEVVWAQHQAVLDKIEHDRLHPPRAEPRIAFLGWRGRA